MKQGAFVIIVLCLFSACTAEMTPSTQESAPAETTALHHLQSEALPEGPQLFLEGLVSTGENEFGTTFSPDGKTVYFCRGDRARANICAIFTSSWNDSEWSTPEIASFSGGGFDVDPFVMSDGSLLLFNSRRPTSPGDTSRVLNIWAVERTEDGWGEPYPLEALNSSGYEIYQTATTDGRVIFSSDRDGGLGDLDIYVSEYDGETFSEPVNIGAPVNTSESESNALIAPDGSWIMYASGDDFVLSKYADGQWGEPQKLGEPFNTDQHEFAPSVDPTGKFLFFSRRSSNAGIPDGQVNTEEFMRAISGARNGLGDVFFIPTVALSELANGGN